MKVTITSPNKGSNPGGMCQIEQNNKQKMFYLKYCPGTRLKKSNPFAAEKQPLYEALTCKLSNYIGLIIPNIYVIDNINKDLEFDYSCGKCKKLSTTMPYYFLSEIEEDPKLSDEDERRLAEMVEYEKPLMDLLLIDDIVGKRPNYTIYKGERPFYLDLGCSFVRAVQGQLLQKNEKCYNVTKKEFKNALKRLKRMYIVNPNNHMLMNLEELVDHIPKTHIPLINSEGIIKKYNFEDLTTIEELNEIITCHAMCFDEVSSNYVKNNNKNPDALIIKK